jgi:hypothetical protein
VALYGIMVVSMVGTMEVKASVACVLLSKSLLDQLSAVVSLTGCLGLYDVSDC